MTLASMWNAVIHYDLSVLFNDAFFVLFWVAVIMSVAALAAVAKAIK